MDDIVYITLIPKGMVMIDISQFKTLTAVQDVPPMFLKPYRTRSGS